MKNLSPPTTSKELDDLLLKVPLKDNLEELVPVKDLAAKKKAHLVYSEPEPLLRKSVAIKLLAAAKEFADQGYTLVLESSYRSLGDQAQRYLNRKDEFQKKYPDKSEVQILELADTYTAGIPILAAHTGGAAVDVVLLDKDQQPVDFGVPYRHGGDESITNYPALEKTAKANRETLVKVMAKHGFINYPFEYWHFSIGDVCAAYLSHQPTAIYGPVDFDPKSGKTIAIDKHLAYRHFSKGEDA